MSSHSRTIFREVVVVLGASLVACTASSDGLLTENQTEPIGNPTGNSLPSSMSTMVVEGSDGSGNHQESCHAVLITRTVALTAAHCFADFHPQVFGSATLFGQTVSLPQGGWEAVIEFHPKAWGLTPSHPWTVPHYGPNSSSDLAIVRLQTPAANSFTVAKLWNPLQAHNVNFTGANATVGGHKNGDFYNGVTGTQELIGLLPIGSGSVLEGTSQPSGLQPGDSGGGAFLSPAVQLPGQAGASSGPLWTACAQASAGSTNETVLVGIASSGGGTDYWAPTFTYSNLSWIAKASAADVDGDGWCDDADNCAEVANPSQDNCNVVAEREAAWGSSGIEFGDACDPVPCAKPELDETSFEGTGVVVPWLANGNVVCSAELGRSNRDRLLRFPVLANGDSPVSTQTASVYYCDCRDASGVPISDRAICELPPHNCRMDPAELNKPEGGGADSPALFSFWRKLTLTDGSAPVAQPTAMTYVAGGTEAVHYWDYKSDFADWLFAGWVAPGSSDPNFGPGTDLGGVLWTRDTTSTGAGDHGCAGCSLADNFSHGHQPDPKAELVRCKKLPRYRPAPWWTYCAVCGDGLLSWLGDDVINPVVTLFDELDVAVSWQANGASDVSESLDTELFKALTNESILFAAPSEPIDVAGYRGAPRAIAIDLDAGAAVGEVLRGSSGFKLAPIAVEFGGKRKAEHDGGSVGATLSLRARAVYTVFSNRVELFRLGESSATTLELSHPLDGIRSVVFVANLGQLWVIGESEGRFELHWIDLTDGVVKSHSMAESIPRDEEGDAWLTIDAGGGVILTTASSDGYAVWRARDGQDLEFEFVAKGIERPVMPPSIHGDTLTVAVSEIAPKEGVRVLPIEIRLSQNKTENTK